MDSFGAHFSTIKGDNFNCRLEIRIFVGFLVRATATGGVSEKFSAHILSLRCASYTRSEFIEMCVDVWCWKRLHNQIGWNLWVVKYALNQFVEAFFKPSNYFICNRLFFGSLFLFAIFFFVILTAKYIYYIAPSIGLRQWSIACQCDHMLSDGIIRHAIREIKSVGCNLDIQGDMY